MARLVTMVSVCVLATTFGCGGDSKKEAATPATTAEEEEVEEPAPVVEISEDKLNYIAAKLKRKGDSVSRCFGDALKAGEVTRKDRGKVTVRWIITKDGTVRNAEVSDSSLKSKVLHECVLGKVRRWTFPTLPAELPYSRRFGFSYF